MKKPAQVEDETGSRTLFISPLLYFVSKSIQSLLLFYLLYFFFLSLPSKSRSGRQSNGNGVNEALSSLVSVSYSSQEKQVERWKK